MMTQKNRRIYLIKYLLNEQYQYKNIKISNIEQEQKNLLRTLFNIRMPKTVSEEFLKIQDAYLKEEIENLQ